MKKRMSSKLHIFLCVFGLLLGVTLLVATLKVPGQTERFELEMVTPLNDGSFVILINGKLHRALDAEEMRRLAGMDRTIRSLSNDLRACEWEAAGKSVAE